MWRKSKGAVYYVFPGGGVEKNESIEEAVVREVKEEASITVHIDKLLYHHHYVNDSDQYYYLCSYISGEPVLGDYNEKAEMVQSTDNIYQPMWVNTASLSDLTVYPLEIRDWLMEDLKNNFIDTPRMTSMEVRDLRQT